MRLIDADSFFNDIKGWQEDIQDNEYDANKFDFVFERIYEMFEEIPTAYDIDKVVEELECDRCESCSLLEVCAGSKYCGKCHEKIIEIVKQGGVTDDVCEWKQTSIARYKTSCGYKLEEYFDTKACYCKQCGKKIKVVE